jgi:hypothetical protein
MKAPIRVVTPKLLLDVGYRYRSVPEIPSEDLAPVISMLRELGLDVPNMNAEAYAERFVRRVEAGLKTLESGKAWSFKLITHVSCWIPTPFQTRGHRKPWYVSDRPDPEAPPNRLHITRTQRREWSLVIAETLAQAGDRLCRCLECRRLFIRAKRQRYCTESCQRRASRSRANADGVTWTPRGPQMKLAIPAKASAGQVATIIRQRTGARVVTVRKEQLIIGGARFELSSTARRLLAEGCWRAQTLILDYPAKLAHAVERSSRLTPPIATTTQGSK